MRSSKKLLMRGRRLEAVVLTRGIWMTGETKTPLPQPQPWENTTLVQPNSAPSGGLLRDTSLERQRSPYLHSFWEGEQRLLQTCSYLAPDSAERWEVWQIQGVALDHTLLVGILLFSLFGSKHLDEKQRGASLHFLWIGLCVL